MRIFLTILWYVCVAVFAVASLTGLRARLNGNIPKAKRWWKAGGIAWVVGAALTLTLAFTPEA